MICWHRSNVSSSCTDPGLEVDIYMIKSVSLPWLPGWRDLNVSISQCTAIIRDWKHLLNSCHKVVYKWNAEDDIFYCHRIYFVNNLLEKYTLVQHLNLQHLTFLSQRRSKISNIYQFFLSIYFGVVTVKQRFTWKLIMNIYWIKQKHLCWIHNYLFFTEVHSFINPRPVHTVHIPIEKIIFADGEHSSDHSGPILHAGPDPPEVPRIQGHLHIIRDATESCEDRNPQQE